MSGRIPGAGPSPPRRNSGCQCPLAGHGGAGRLRLHLLQPPTPPGHRPGHHPTRARALRGHGHDPHPTVPTLAVLPATAPSRVAAPGPGPSPHLLPHPPHLPHIGLSEPRGSLPCLPGKQGRSQCGNQPCLHCHRPPKLLLLLQSLPRQETRGRPGGRSGRSGAPQGGGPLAAAVVAAAIAAPAPVPGR